MKKILLSIALLIGSVLCSVQLCSAQDFNNVSDIFKYYKTNPKADYLVINQNNRSILSQDPKSLKKKYPNIDFDDLDVDEMLMASGVEKIEIISMDRSKSTDRKAILAAMDKFAAKDYQTLASSNEGDDVSRVLGKSNGNVFSEIIICDIDGNDADFIRITGKINPQHLTIDD